MEHLVVGLSGHRFTMTSCFWLAVWLVVGCFNSMSTVDGLTCYCSGFCPNGEPNGTCVAKPDALCFTAIEEVINAAGSAEFEFTYGCLPPDEMGFMQCKGHLVPHETPKSITCCDSENLCNKELKPVYIDRRPKGNGFDDEMFAYNDNMHKFAYIFTSILLIVIVAVASCKYGKCRRKTQNSVEEGKSFIATKNRNLFVESSTTGSGSGSGLAMMVQQTISKQLEFIKTIGKGKYGDVWLAKWRADEVAVKVFVTSEEQSWNRETEIYQTVLLRHENILGFIAADIRGTGSSTQMILVTDYHHHGSLYDYLTLKILDEADTLRLMYTAAAGLCHLHTEIRGKQGKPSIAHRDVKTRNILVKRDGTCCIADFGLAVKYDSKTDEIDIKQNTRVGTKRYMAPEIVENLPLNLMNEAMFNFYKKADMYSFSLVLWEIGRRGCINGQVDEYQLPFYEYLPHDPSFDDMRKIVCDQDIRPSFSAKWNQSPMLTKVRSIIEEGWHRVADSRSTSLRVKKSLHDLLKKYHPKETSLSIDDDDADSKKALIINGMAHKSSSSDAMIKMDS